MATHLTQRDRIMIAEVIRRYLARDIEQREIVDTYKADVLSVLAFDLAEFADELINCCDVDSVALAAAVAGDLADFGGTDDYVACGLADLLAPIPTLSKLDTVLAFGPDVQFENAPQHCVAASPRYSKRTVERLHNELQQFHDEHGRSPTTGDAGWKAWAQWCRRNGLVWASFTGAEYKRTAEPFDEDAVADSLRRFVAEHGRLPKVAESKQWQRLYYRLTERALTFAKMAAKHGVWAMPGDVAAPPKETS